LLIPLEQLTVVPMVVHAVGDTLALNSSIMDRPSPSLSLWSPPVVARRGRKIDAARAAF
jgi:hypothetical protein